MQLALLPRQQLEPLPVDSRCYVAAVQNKPGELDALERASAATWERMTPLVHIVGHLKARDRPYSADSIRDRVKRIFEVVGHHPLYLDVLRLDPFFPVSTSRGDIPVLAQIYAAARKRGLCFVPVVWVGESTKKHLGLVAEAAVEDRHGVALRYKFLRSAVPTGMTRASLLTQTLDELGCEATDADLLIDLEVLDPDEDFDAATIARSITEITRVGSWRSIVLLGTSMPKMMSCIEEGTLGSLERREWTLWTELREQGLARVPAFGDYAVQHPHPPMEEGGGNTMRANVRYTTATQTLVARGRGPVRIEGNEQYRSLCQQLVARPEFCGSTYTWGDGIIADCATGAVEPGAQRMWRGAATSHHLRFVTEQLRQQVTAPS